MRQTLKTRIVLWIFFVAFIGYSCTLIFPFLWTFINSFKGNKEFFAPGGVWSAPKEWLVSNYKKVFEEYPLGRYFVNSVIFTFGGTILSIASSACTAYVVSKYDFKFKKLIYTVAITVMLIPAVGTIAALYKFMNQTGLYDSYIGILLLYSGGFGVNFLILYGYFQGVSWSYAEAAFVDGATDWQVFYKIMIPQARPSLGAVAIIQGINIWNDYFNPFMFLSDEKKFPLAVGLQEIVLQQSYNADWPKMFAAMIITMIPILIIYIIFQDVLIENTVAGGLKG